MGPTPPKRPPFNVLGLSFAARQQMLEPRPNGDGDRHAGGRDENVVEPSRMAHRRGDPFARRAATASGVVVGALFPQLMRSWLTISAISASESCAPHAGIAPG